MLVLRTVQPHNEQQGNARGHHQLQQMGSRLNDVQCHAVDSKVALRKGYGML